jgi:hypothetical protein
MSHLFYALIVLAASTQVGAQDAPLVQGSPGETLSETLEHNNGVIKPPPVDPEIVAPPPPVDTRTPIIEPPAPPQHNPPRKPER